jgi:hypothetical protein
LIFTFGFVFSIIPSKGSINGSYLYINDGVVMEEVVLHINNTVEYYLYDSVSGTKTIAHNGRVTKWRCILNNGEYNTFKENGFIASPYQIQFCNDDWGSHFQFFKMNNTTLYSKPTNSEKQQKCYIKK